MFWCLWHKQKEQERPGKSLAVGNWGWRKSLFDIVRPRSMAFLFSFFSHPNCAPSPTPFPPFSLTFRELIAGRQVVPGMRDRRRLHGHGFFGHFSVFLFLLRFFLAASFFNRLLD
jgi:hypothetical protein